MMKELIFKNDPYEMNWIRPDFPYGEVGVPEELSATSASVREGDVVQTEIRIKNEGKKPYFTNIEDIDDYPEIESILVKREEYVLIVPKNHRLANREEVSLKELKDEYFIAYNDKSSDKRISYSDFMGYTPKISAEPTEASVLSGLVAAGAGIAIIINTPMINTNKISTIKIKEDIGYKSIYIGWNRDSYMTEIRKAFNEYVLSLSEDV